MTFRKFPLLLSGVLFLGFGNARPANADSSHARIVRLSSVEGDVRFARDVHGDPLADIKAIWEKAMANQPIAQNDVIATDNGRAEVEFENGSAVFLYKNSVLEFYDLSLNDGTRTTRLVLRQGTISVYVNPLDDEYFSVTGGDFTVEANGKTRFRIDNYDDGSKVGVQQGRVIVVTKHNTEHVSKGQSLSMKAGDENSIDIGRLGESDDFDRWVATKAEALAAATNAAMQYSNGGAYVAGFSALYTYGSWFSCGDAGYGWRPFGAALGWSPYTGGQWVYDPSFGWTWISAQPWGWVPYHYGGWLFDSSCGGWFYSPGTYFGFYGGYPGIIIRGNPGRPRKPTVHPPRPLYRAATATFVRQNGKIGVVPVHPLDQKGKTPLNLEHGVFPLGSAGGSMQVNRGEKLETLKSLPREAMASSVVATNAPERVSRTLIEGTSGQRVISFGHDSSIVYDPSERRFVNNATSTNSSSDTAKVGMRAEPGKTVPPTLSGTGNNGTAPRGTAIVSGRGTSGPVVAPRSSVPPAPRVSTPPPPSRSWSASSGGSGSSSSGSTWSRGSSSSSSSSSSSASSGRSSSSSGSSSSSSSSGRPH